MHLRKYQKQAIKETFEALIKNDEPVLMESSVGSGKSIMIGYVVKRFEDQSKRVLCLVNSSELVRNNSKAFKDLGGSPSIFCASLGFKEYTNNIIFATPQSVISAIKNNHPISQIIFNMIVVDEAHGINYSAETSTFMRILRHYKQAYKPMRLLGLTGTAFRGSNSIVGENALFKTQVGNISTQYLIEHGFLVKPNFGGIETDSYDFSKCKIKNTGEFSGRDLQAEVDSKKRLTWEILQSLQIIMQSRNICMVFCSTRAHCFEALAALPESEACVILGDTPVDERHESLTLARNKKIKYLISVNCLMTGVNITALDCIAWLRPTSSLLLYIQGIGRGLRLHEGKTDCLILDFSGNTTRFSDIDDPIINEALQPKDPDDPYYCIPCLTCAQKGITTLNKVTGRRCIGIHEGARCDHYFEWKDCHECLKPADITSRYCPHCEAELIDPNAKLTLRPANEPKEIFIVIQAKYWVLENEHPSFNAMYLCMNGLRIYESFVIRDSRTANIFYGSFVKNCLDKPSQYYPVLNSVTHLRKMLDYIKTPSQIECTFKGNRYRINKRIFNHEEIFTS